MASKPKRKLPTLPEDLEGMFRTTEVYQLGARILQTNMQLGIMVVLPWIALSALSLEIILKCLIKLEGGTLEGIHDLKNLFGKLSEPSRARIRDAIERLFLPQYNHQMEIAYKELNRAHKTDHPYIPVGFDWIVENIAFAFQNARYPYEIDEASGELVSRSTQPVNWVGGELFYATAREIILEKKPEWATPQK